MSSQNEDAKANNIQALFAQALKSVNQSSDTPLRRLVRKIMNEERKYLFSDQKPHQRKKNIKDFIDEARSSGEDFSG